MWGKVCICEGERVERERERERKQERKYTKITEVNLSIIYHIMRKKKYVYLKKDTVSSYLQHKM